MFGDPWCTQKSLAAMRFLFGSTRAWGDFWLKITHERALWVVQQIVFSGILSLHRRQMCFYRISTDEGAYLPDQRIEIIVKLSILLLSLCQYSLNVQQQSSSPLNHDRSPRDVNMVALL